MKRRNFITLLGAAAAAWPLAARAQQSEPMRRIGILVSSGEDDEGKPRIAAFQEHCSHLVVSRGATCKSDVRWGGGDAQSIRKYAAELAARAGHYLG
jgi:putative tryptophan/tyrosine transport system substrate-binding protein